MFFARPRVAFKRGAAPHAGCPKADLCQLKDLSAQFDCSTAAAALECEESSGSVIRLDLSGNGLGGVFPSELGLLIGLTRLCVERARRVVDNRLLTFASLSILKGTRSQLPDWSTAGANRHAGQVARARHQRQPPPDRRLARRNQRMPGARDS